MIDLIIYLVLAFMLGFVLAYIFQKQRITTAGEQIIRLTAEASSKISREELAKTHVARESYAELEKSLQELKNTLSASYVPLGSYTLVTDSLDKAVKELKEKEALILSLTRQKTELEKQREAVEDKVNVFRRQLEELHENSREQFKVLAADVLEEKKKLFIESNRSELNNILGPLKNDLDIFKKKVEDTRKEDIRDLTSLKIELDSLHKLNTQLSNDAQSLVRALKSDTRVQGNWGEDRLRFILESEGLQKHIDYADQQTYRDEETASNKRPDFILKLPGGRHIVIDSKVSLTAYVNYCNAAQPEERSRLLRLHVKSITDHIDLLSEKNYQSLPGLNTPDYVFMFMPIEAAVTLALNEREDLFTRALAKKIVIITPTTLVATLKVVKILWQKENQVKNVEAIFKQCGALYDKFVTFLEEMDNIGRGLQTANRSYKDAMDRLKDGARKGDTILGRFESIKKLEAKTTKSIPRKFLDELNILEEDNLSPLSPPSLPERDNG